MAVIRVLLTDDLQANLQASLRGEANLAFVGEAKDQRGWQRLCEELAVDVVLLDLGTPNAASIETIRLLRTHCPEVKLMVVAANDYGDFVRELAREGVAGYLLGSDTAAAVLQAMRTVKAGGTWFSREAIERMVRQESAHDALELTEREREVLGAMVRGWDNARIATELHLSEQTVRNYVSRVYDKMGVRTRAEAIVWAVKNGLVDREM